MTTHLFIHRFANQSVVAVKYDPATSSFTERCFGKVPRGRKHWDPFEKNVFSVIHKLKSAKPKKLKFTHAKIGTHWN